MAYFGRGKNKITGSYTMVDFYKYYIKDISKDDPYYVTYSEYVEIISLYNKAVVDILYDQSLEYKIPHNLGKFRISKKKRNNNHSLSYATQIDWANTVKYGKKIYHVNEHSDGYRYLFTWDKNGQLKNIKSYKFVPCRANKRKLAYYIKNKINDYFEVK